MTVWVLKSNNVFSIFKARAFCFVAKQKKNKLKRMTQILSQVEVVLKKYQQS